MNLIVSEERDWDSWSLTLEVMFSQASTILGIA